MAANSSIASSAPTGRVLVVDDHARARESMADVLRHAGHQVQCCSCAAEALQVLQTARYDCIVTDLKMPGMTGIELIIQLRQRQCTTQIVMVTAHATVATAVEAMRHGAFDYIEKPFEADALERLVTQAMRHGRLVHPEPADVLAAADASSPAMIGSSPVMQALRMRILQIGPTSETVLITGESGTGKELVARAIHAASHRHGMPMVSLNCPVLSAHLMESELFGHEKGAFTGAVSQKIGRLELADKGTLFLDEIGEIPLELQPKLLRVLQDYEFERLGGTRTIHVDIRLIAATNRDLARAVEEKQFRRDLFYRLHVFPLRLPALRERREDIPLLVRYFVDRCAARMGKRIEFIPDEAIEAMLKWKWPGNIRELENFIERSVILSEGNRLRPPLAELQQESSGFEDNSDDTLRSRERDHIIAILRQTRGLLSGPGGAAARLGMKRTTLQYRIQKLGISRMDYLE